MYRKSICGWAAFWVLEQYPVVGWVLLQRQESWDPPMYTTNLQRVAEEEPRQTQTGGTHLSFIYSDTCDCAFFLFQYPRSKLLEVLECSSCSHAACEQPPPSATALPFPLKLGGKQVTIFCDLLHHVDPHHGLRQVLSQWQWVLPCSWS